MGYIVLLALIAVLPLALGYTTASRGAARPRLRTWQALVLTAAAVGGWFGLTVLARRYAETDLPAWQAAEWWAHTGKWYCFAVVSLFVLGVAARREQPPHRRYRIVLCSIAVLMVIWIAVWRTFPIYTFLVRGLQRDEDGHIRQTVPYTCGPVSLANLLERFGMTDEFTTEHELARISGTTYEGSTMSGLICAGRKLGLDVVECRIMSIEELETAGQPAIVFISTIPAVHHAVLYIGTRDNLIEFIDPDRGHLAYTRSRFKDIHYGKSLILAKARSDIPDGGK